MKTYLLLIIELIFALQTLAQTITRQDGLLYRLYRDGEDGPFAEVFGYALEDNASVLIPDKIVKDDLVYPVTRIADYAFNNCKEIVAVTIGSNIKNISEGVFNECYNLKSVTMSDSVYSIGGYAFNRCVKLERIDFANNLEYIFFSAFSYSGLTEIILPNSLKIIADDAFQYCHNLKSITIQSKLRIDREVFKGCESISEINYNSSALGGSTKDIFDSNIYKTAKLYVQEGCLQVAYDTEPWLYFVHIEEKSFAAINKVKRDDVEIECDAEIYNLFSGIKYIGNINDILPGIYVVRRENSVKKIVVK